MDKRVIAIEGKDTDLTSSVCKLLSTRLGCYVVPNYQDSFLEMVQREMSELEIRRIARGQQNSIDEYLSMKGSQLIVDRSYLSLLRHVESLGFDISKLEPFREQSNEMEAFWLGVNSGPRAAGWDFETIDVEGKTTQDIVNELI